MSNTRNFVYAIQENTSTNELYIHHDENYTNTGLSLGHPDNKVARLSYQDGSGAILQSKDSLTLQSDHIKLHTLPEATSDTSYNFIVITNDGTLQRGSTYVSDIADAVTKINAVNNDQEARLKQHDTDISNLKLNVSTIISQIEQNLIQIQLDLNTLTTTTVLNDKKIQTQFNWLYGILLVLFIILIIIIIILFITNRHSNKLISTMKSQLDTMSKDMAVLNKAMIELIKS